MIHRLKAVIAPLFYCLLASSVLRLLAVTLCVLLLAPSASQAAPGEFTVANCQADEANFSVSAFTHFAHRGMLIRYACRPTGPGLRGVVTQNVVRKGRVKRGSVAEVTIAAPPGTRMTTYTWAGAMRRRDCRYALQMWADAPGGKPIPIQNVKANHNCPRPRRAQAAQFLEKTFSIPGATKVTQRVTCVGTKKQKWCSTREPNFIKTERASVVFIDAQAPSVQILSDTPLATGVWVSGKQPLGYTASDNVGIHVARAVVGGRGLNLHARDCLLIPPNGPFTAPQPCPNGGGQIEVETREAADGTQQLLVQAQDAAGNTAVSAPVVARIDNTPPGRVAVEVEGGDDWRNTNDWAAVWSGPDEGDRAPVTATHYDLCLARTSSCRRGTVATQGISRVPLTVPSSGEWTVSLWRRDAAGNEDQEFASVPVTLRYNPDPPQLAFEPQERGDPTLVAVQAIDSLSGVADGTIQIAASGSGDWRTLPTHQGSSHLIARIDDVALPPGTYLLRARAQDRAGNEAMIDRRGDGQPMVLTLPLRRTPTISAGFERVIRGAGKRPDKVVLRQTAHVGFGKSVRIAGRLTSSDGRPIAGAPLQLLSSTNAGPEQHIETLATDADGRFVTVSTGLNTRRMRLAYAGSLQALPAERQLEMLVPASTSVRPSRRRLRNGQRVTFSGRVRGLPVPADGKLVEIQVRFTDRWQTFRTARSDALGRWSSRYRFQRTRGVQKYRFRVRLPKEAGYPFETSVSRTLTVQVWGT